MDAVRRLPRLAAALGLLLAFWAPRPVQAANLDTIADDVLGQADFIHNGANAGGLGASSLKAPASMALDAQGDLYVADYSNNRVLEYDAPLTTDHIADRVFGQADFTHNSANPSGVSATSLALPTGVALDGAGNLYVTDSGNNRVLEYAAPLSSGMAASRVFGQGGSFTTATANKGGRSAHSLASPFDVALDAAGNLFVADDGNSRVLVYYAPPSASADEVFGQADFTHGAGNRGVITPTASSLNSPRGLGLDAQGRLYVADTFNNRVLEYDTPLINTTADRVFGQPDFSHNDVNHAGRSNHSLSSPWDVALDARGDLYTADAGNHRVLEYNAPLSNSGADRVFGQSGSFATGATNQGGLGASSLSGPTGVAVDAAGNLYVADLSNNRALEYDLPVPHGVPALAALSPSQVAVGSPSFTLTVNGTGFYDDSVIRWNGSSRATTFIKSTQLTATVSAGDLSTGGPFAVTVFTPAPGGGTSTLINLTLYTRVGHDTTADTEQGQPNFMAPILQDMPGANRLTLPSGVAVMGQTGRLFVTDGFNSRVLSWPNAAALANGQAADLVLGQPTFASLTANAGGRSARSLANPNGVALDGHGNLYVADAGNNRVLEYNAPLSSGLAASHVFGQGGSFTTGTANNGGVSANGLSQPQGLALDGQGNLYVADAGNNRVLEYDGPLTTDGTADHVFGQPDFTSATADNGGLNANSLASPVGVGLDSAGNLYVADEGNNRVLEYNTPLSSSLAASHAFGQPNFTSSAPNNGGINNKSLYAPRAVALDGWGNLYVADELNNRVLEYDAPLTNRTADRVFGQPGFTTGVYNFGGVSANSLNTPQSVALDAQANLYVADTFNNRVLEFDWALAKLDLPLVMR